MRMYALYFLKFLKHMIFIRRVELSEPKNFEAYIEKSVCLYQQDVYGRIYFGEKNQTKFLIIMIELDIL